MKTTTIRRRIAAVAVASVGMLGLFVASGEPAEPTGAAEAFARTCAAMGVFVLCCYAVCKLVDGGTDTENPHTTTSQHKTHGN